MPVTRKADRETPNKPRPPSRKQSEFARQMQATGRMPGERTQQDGDKSRDRVCETPNTWWP